MQKTFKVTASTIYPLGVQFIPEGLHISMIFEAKTECGILLYDRQHREGIRIPFPPENHKGKIYSMLLKDYQDRACSYLFYQGEELFQDPYAKAIVKEGKYGQKKETLSHCRVSETTYEWESDKAPMIPFEDSIFYMLHVRGFTKHKSSGVKAKGTYQGIVEKIPYLKELGITAVLLMPAYEFDEVILPVKRKQPQTMEEAVASYKEPIISEEDKTIRVNYWGYKEGLYYLPKYAYAYTKDAVTEYKDMVKALHQNGIEVMMQFYFPPSVSHMDMLEILKFWVVEYHIDGFQLMGMDIPLPMLCKEPLFSEIKLLCDKDTNEVPHDENVECYRNFGYMDDAFMYDTRKLLKGDDNQINNFIHHNRKNSKAKGIINYIAKQEGFRLSDLVSYDRKHNMANGEGNQDGTSYNCSWNCGVEGLSRKKSILSLRLKQMKNAMTFVLLSQGTPLLYSGDEFANTQEGNNNPYCQDNPIGWIKWNLQKSNKELLEYVKSLIAFRKAHSVFHAKEPLRGMDYLSCGYPDVSYHGKEAWSPDTGPASRSVGILYCGNYGQVTDNAKAMDTELFYFGINMHWETHRFGLPKLADGLEWIPLFSTQPDIQDKWENSDNILIPPRTIIILGIQKILNYKNTKKKRTRQ